MSETPDLQYYKIAVSSNGGPIAFMLRENTLLLNKKDDTKNMIFIFSSYGHHITTIKLKEKITDLKDNQRWVAFYFTDEEDLFLISDDGLCYFIDPKTSEFRNNGKGTRLCDDFGVNYLCDTRFDQTTNMLALRDTANRFYYINNVEKSLSVNKCTSSDRLEDMADGDDSKISDYIIIP